MKKLFTIRHKVWDGGSETIWMHTVVRSLTRETAMEGFNRLVDTKYDDLCTLENVKELTVVEL